MTEIRIYQDEALRDDTDDAVEGVGIPLEWSETMSCSTSTLPVFSPSGDLVASVVDKTNIVVRNVDTLSVVSYMTCLSPPSYLEWSPNGAYILACMPKRATVSVFCVVSMSEEESSSSWMCSLTEPLAGVAYATWSPTGNHVFVVSEFQAKLALWSLKDSSCDYGVIQCPKFANSYGIGISPDGRMVAVLVRKDCKDSVLLYGVGEWSLLADVSIDTMNAAGMVWSPDSRYIAVWDAVYAGPRLVVVSQHEVVHTASWASQSGLGIRTVQWSPSGHALAIGTYDTDVKLLNTVTWREMHVMKHGVVVDETSHPMVAAFVEVEQEAEATDSAEEEDVLDAYLRKSSAPKEESCYPSPKKSGARSSLRSSNQRHPLNMSVDGAIAPTITTQYTELSLPVRLPAPRVGSDEVNPPMGVQKLFWSPTGRFIASTCEDRPHVAWVWDACELVLDTILIHMAPIRDFRWRPDESDTLYLVCGSRSVYIWGPQAATCVHVADEKFRGLNLQWSNNAKVLHACSKESFSCGFLESLAP
ncbi:hypothetical protein M9435_006071 [Picochlorum sp. BPE23]|nr:hypothetical protein M9435_006071 [Picochlorum sp. BPE23]